MLDATQFVVHHIAAEARGEQVKRLFTGQRGILSVQPVQKFKLGTKIELENDFSKQDGTRSIKGNCREKHFDLLIALTLITV